MNSRSLLIALTLFGLALVAWHLRWVLLILFGAVVVAVALDVLITQLRTRTRLNRPQALSVVLVMLLLAAVVLGQLPDPSQAGHRGRSIPSTRGPIRRTLGAFATWNP